MAFATSAKPELAGFLGHRARGRSTWNSRSPVRRQRGGIPAGDGVGDFVGFLDRVGAMLAKSCVSQGQPKRGHAGCHDVQQAAELSSGVGIDALDCGILMPQKSILC